MEEVNIQDFSSVCRLCLSEHECFISIFDENYNSLPQRIADCVNVQVQESDKVTTMICKSCLSKIDEWYDFKKCCEDSQSKLRIWVNGHERIDLVDISIKEEPADSIDDPMQVLETSMCIKSEPIDSVYLEETEVDVVGGALSPTSSLSVSGGDQMDSLLVPALECPASAHGINAPFYSKNSYVNGRHDSSDLSRKASSLRVSDLGTTCRICSKTFSNVHNRFRHERTVHNLEREVSVTHFMSAAGEQIDDSVTDHSEESSNVTLEQFAASLHLVQRNSVRPVSEKQFIDFNKKIHNMMASGTCECCNLVYSSTAALFEHLSKQMQLEPYTCFLCCITFPDESQFVEHAHQNFCEQRVTLLDSSDCTFKVYQHYECVECKIFFVHDMFLTKHLLNTHLPEEFPTTCPHCDTSFETQDDYKLHMQESCFSKVYCSICKMYFATINEFEKHSKIHDDASSSTPRTSNRIEANNAASPPENENNSSTASSGRRPNNLVLMTRTTKCQLCGKQYSNFHNLLRHIKINHQNKLISCLFCAKKFLLQDDFRKHTLKEHKSLVKATKNGDVYACEKCEVGSATIEEWCDHQVTHIVIQSFPCNECDQTFDEEEELEEHKNMHANLKLKLYRCSDSNSYKTSSDYSIQSFNYNFFCEPCDKYFETEEDYCDHKATHPTTIQESSIDDDVKPNDLVKRFNCPYCKKSYSCYSSMWKHKKKHHGKNSRKFLGMVATKHFGKKRMCPICYKVVPTSKALWYHKKKFHGMKSKSKLVPQIDQNGPELYNDEILDGEEDGEENICEVCNKQFRTQKGLVMHSRLHTHPQIKNDDIKYKCDLCPKEFLSPEVLENHIKCHSDKPTFVCPVCQKHFMNNAGLASHVRIHSTKLQMPVPSLPIIKTENDDFKCSVCSVILSNRSALSNHVKVHLRDNSTFACPLCPRKFAGPATLDNHMKYVHAGENGLANNSIENEVASTAAPNDRFACTICDRSFLREGLLKNHMKAHEMTHSKNRIMVRKYKCHDCKKYLPSPQALARHQEREHDTQLTCNECNKKFASAGALASHKGWHLRTNSTLSKTNVCTSCDMFFELKEDYIAHLQSHKQKLHCQYCGRNFFNVAALKKHIALIHGNESVKLKKKLVHNTEYNSKPLRASEGAYKCTQCNAQFLTAKKLRMHVSIHAANA